ncbi:MAG: hypothetical protein ACE5HF_11420 [Gemmatimonadota bacterium]
MDAGAGGEIGQPESHRRGGRRQRSRIPDGRDGRLRRCRERGRGHPRRPRVLQALARDGVLPASFRWLGRGTGPEDTPRAGTLVTLGVALVAVWFGNLNLIAPILTMFFLTTYGVLNVAAGVERLLGSPSFRPRFKVHWSLSALGAVGCGAVMFLVSPLASVLAAVIVVGIYVWLERRELRTAWGDVRRGIWMALTRAGLLRLRTATDARNWRPHLLVLSGAPTRRWHLIDFATAVTHGRALLTVSSVLTDPAVTPERQTALEATLREYLEKRGVHALPRLIRAPSPFEGARRLVDAYGLGGLVPNTFLIGDSEDASRREAYCAMIEAFHDARRNVVILHRGASGGYGRRRRIDVWWGGMRGNGGLMMTLAYLLQTSLPWRGASLRVKMVVAGEEAAEKARPNLAAIVAGLRSGATSEIIVAGGRAFPEILRESSARADLVFLGMRAPGDGEQSAEFTAYYEGLRDLAGGLPTVAFVLAAEDVTFGDILFREREPEE